jgi:hypothetical protein
MSGITRSGTMVNSFYGHCKTCDERIERPMPVSQVGDATIDIRIRCPSCGDPVRCHVGSMASRQGRRAVVFADTGVHEVDLEGSA